MSLKLAPDEQWWSPAKTEVIVAAVRQVAKDLCESSGDDNDHLRAQALFEAADRMEDMLNSGGNLTRALCWANSPQAGVEGPPREMHPGVVAEWFRVNGRPLPVSFGLRVFPG